MRTSGILMHISSLPSPYGIGTFGKEAFEFIDFLTDAGQTYWQILPICPTGYGDSPYQSFSAYACNPYFIDFRILEKEGLLKVDEYEGIDWGGEKTKVDYSKIYRNRYKVLLKAFNRFKMNISDDYLRFCEENSFWLEDYSLFSALKNVHGGRPFYEWEECLVKREYSSINAVREKYANEIIFCKVLQYWCFSQWQSVKEYANKKGIRIIGDIPIYVARDSADLWSNPELFALDDRR